MVNTKIPIVLVICMFAAGCGEFYHTTALESVSALEVHIMNGLEDHWVFIETGDGNFIQTFVESPPTQSRSQIVHYFEVDPNQSLLAIRWAPSNGNKPSQSSFISLRLDAGKEYILRLTAENGRIQPDLQEESI